MWHSVVIPCFYLQYYCYAFLVFFFVHRRNDFISVVRNAARTALENMNIPEAEDVLKVTKVLEDEIAALSTVDHQVAV